MGQHWTFWTSGIAVVPQKPNLPGVEIERNGLGTDVLQSTGTNWFYYAIPTPNEIGDNRDINLLSVCFRATLNMGVKIIELAVWVGRNEVCRLMKLNIWGPDVYHVENLGSIRVRDVNNNLWNPVSLLIRVEFPENGKITFEGAGATFETP